MRLILQELSADAGEKSLLTPRRISGRSEREFFRESQRIGNVSQIIIINGRRSPFTNGISSSVLCRSLAQAVFASFQLTSRTNVNIWD